MTHVPRKFIALIVLIILFALIWPKVRFIFFIPMTLTQAVLGFAVVALVLFLAVDHWLNRTR